jgi:hypothetical protein
MNAISTISWFGDYESKDSLQAVIFMNRPIFDNQLFQQRIAGYAASR